MIKKFFGAHRRGLILLSSFVLTLTLTGGLYAFTYTTRSVQWTVDAATSDFADISTNQTPSTITLLGAHTGKIDAYTLFDITGDSAYSGDLEVIVSLANPDELIEDYRFWQLRLEYTDSDNNSADLEAMPKVISLSNPTASFAVDSANISGGTFYLRTPGGVYRSLPYVLGSSGSDPLIFCEVVQAGAQ